MITLSKSDFHSLSSEAQEEILVLLRSVEPRKAPVQPELAEDLDDQPIELTPKMTKNFMAGVSDRTESFLRVFAENGGRASLKQLSQVYGTEDWRKLSGITAGITRRIRRLFSDEEAYLLAWDEKTEVLDNEGLLIDGVYYVSDMTCHSLRKYFELE